MLAASKNVLFPGHNHLLTTGTGHLTLIIAQAPASEVTSVPVVVTRWIVYFFCSVGGMHYNRGEIRMLYTPCPN